MSENTENGLPLETDIDELVDEYLQRKQAGEDISVEKFADIYSSRRDEILSLLPVVDYLEASDPKINPQLVGTAHLPNVLLGDYKIIRLIGFGGMGTVYEAEHFLRSQVALKVMLSKNESDGRRFEREAKIVAGLHHPNIVPVFDFGATGSVNYMSMRCVNGPNLSQVMDARKDGTADEKARNIAQKIDRDWTMTARIGYQIAQALDYAHSQGVLHRDIKPANLLIEDDDHVWVTDFGLAKLNYVASSLTKTGNAVGTLQYMAPEQLDNESDVRTDVYSLGITLYELTLRNQNSSTSIYTRHPLKKPSHFSPTIPKGLEDVILKACSPDPADRFQTAAEFAASLATYCGHRKSNSRFDDGNQIWKLRNVISLAAIIILTALVMFRNRPENLPRTVFEYAISKTASEKNTRILYDPKTGIATMATRVCSGTDDAEEWMGDNSYPQGKIYTKSSDLEMVWDGGPQLTGIRFSDVKLPKRARIRTAHIQFTSDQNDIGPTNLQVFGDLSVKSDSFERDKFNISKRLRTNASIDWVNIEPWAEDDADSAQLTPDLTPLVKEIMAQPTWDSDDPLTFIITGEGKRSAISYDCEPGHAPKLIIEYEDSELINDFLIH